MNNKFTILFGEIVEFDQFKNSSGRSVDEIISRHTSSVESLSDRYTGTIIESSDHSIKILFKKPENAAKFAIDIYKKFSLGDRIPYRIAINQGNIHSIEKALSDITSKITSDLLQICSEGAVLFPEDFAQLLNNNSSFNIKHIGSTLLKSTNDTINIYCLGTKGLYVPTQMELSDKTRNKNSIAVLAFHNTSSEKELDYICEGIAEDIIDSLTKAENIFVTARSSSFMFKNTDTSILEIGRKLNVAYVLDGSIRKRNKEYRISYQLIDSATGYNILSDSFSSDFENLYNSEKKISKKIISHLKPDEKLTNDTDDFYINPVAHSYYLKGKYKLYQWDKDETDKAINCFNKALEVVPGYALAYAGLSTVHAHIALTGFGDFKTNIGKAVQFADLAIEADRSIHDGYVAKGIATFWLGQLYIPDFEQNITTALTISPCNAEIRMFNGMVFLFKGNLKRALSELKLARQLDPFSSSLNLRLGLVQYLNREYQDAHNTFLSQLKDDSYKTNYLLRLAWCCIFLKQYDKSLEYLKDASKDDIYYGMSYACYLAIYQRTKNEDKFYEYKSIIENQEKADPSYAYNHAVLNKLLGKYDIAIQYLEITLQNPLTLFMFFQYDEFWSELHEYPPFVKLIESKYNTKDSQLIRIDSETKEYLEIKDSDFLYAEAQDNYTLIVYKEKNNISKKTLRATLSSVENQINADNIIRCHRSYLVNCTAEFAYMKSEHKDHLQHADLEIKIPISRSKEKELKELFG